MAEAPAPPDLTQLSLSEPSSPPPPTILDGYPTLSTSRPTVPWHVKLQAARLYKQTGNERYKAGQYKAAIGKYHRALLYLRGISQSTEQVPFSNQPAENVPESALEEVDVLSAQCYNNLSACILQSDSPAYDKVVQYCDEVLSDNPDARDAKALYRKGVALYHLGCPEDAIVCLRKAATVPGAQKDGNIIKYMRMCEKSLSDQDKLMKETYKAMFNTS